jgi:orotidine-5'-phosphate decarboxylase
MAPSEALTPKAPALIPEKEARERLIVALDLPDFAQAMELVDELDGVCKWFKVGLELYLASGNSVVDELKRRGRSVFLDLKLHDIPNTVASAVRSVSNLGVDLLTLHALGGPGMLSAAAGVSNAPRLLAVTVLTSMDQQQLAAIGISISSGEQALRLAAMAQRSGIHGFVCSAQEVAGMRATLSNPLLVIPGIRPAGAEVGDQKRVATPASAIAAGASQLVVGRPITQAANRRIAAQSILDEIAAALPK